MIECEVEIEYSLRTKILEEGSEELRAEWNQFWSRYLWAESWVVPDPMPKHVWFGAITGILTYEDMTTIARWGCKFKPSGKSGLLISTLADKVEELGEKVKGLQKSEKLLQGAAVVIRVPDNILLSIKQVDWMDDECTENLQDKLDEGWVILAICPPQGKRRPDYIIGRTEKIN